MVIILHAFVQENLIFLPNNFLYRFLRSADFTVYVFKFQESLIAVSYVLTGSTFVIQLRDWKTIYDLGAYAVRKMIWLFNYLIYPGLSRKHWQGKTISLAFKLKATLLLSQFCQKSFRSCEKETFHLGNSIFPLYYLGLIKSK